MQNGAKKAGPKRLACHSAARNSGCTFSELSFRAE